MFTFVLWLLLHQASVKPRSATVQLVEAQWVLEDSGFMLIKPCDPPGPADSNKTCWEPTKAWSLRCDDPRSIVILPLLSGSAFFDLNKVHDRGDKFWCVLAVEDS